jgi:hypothetical protein
MSLVLLNLLDPSSKFNKILSLELLPRGKQMTDFFNFIINLMEFELLISFC